MKYFVTGTDTQVGKTVTSALICRYAGSLAKGKVFYLKPIQTGGDSDEAVVRNMTKNVETKSLYRFKTPVSPHLSMKLDNASFSYGKMLQSVRETLGGFEHVVVEGAGGVRVPIDREREMIDLMKDVNLPVILVSSSRLGTLNHTLLSVEALDRRGLVIKLIVFNVFGDLREREVIEDSMLTIQEKTKLNLIEMNAQGLDDARMKEVLGSE